MRRNARKDANQQVIVDALRSVGACVEILNNDDLPDILVGFRRKTYLMEIKDGSLIPSRRKLRPGQEKFRQRWEGRGGPLAKIESPDEALVMIGAKEPS